MDDTQIHLLFRGLWSDIAESEEFYNRKPLLAHYTSIQTLEKIVTNKEIWFSNPLLMNDMEELRFVINEGQHLFHDHAELHKACGGKDRCLEIDAGFEVYYDQLSFEHAFDIYAFCFSEHKIGDADGLLSMWRGYGGNGKGAAIVFDTSKLAPIDGSPFILAKVHYLSRDDRKNWINTKLQELANIIRTNEIPDNKLYLASQAFFERLKVFALFTKHSGFKEEKEWRVVYLRDRDKDQRLNPMLGYAISDKGVEPKLKFKIAPVDGVTGEELSLEGLVDHIIVGPSVGGALALHGIRRMLEKSGHKGLAEKLKASSTPFRAV